MFESYCYDALNRLIHYSVAQGGAVACNAAGSKAVTYDAFGDIASKTGVGTYSYPANGQPRIHAVSSITGTVNGVVNPTYTYDANGNMTAGAGRTASYAADNMPTSIAEGALNNQIVYDPEHQRVEQTQTTGATTIHTFYLNDPVSESMEELRLAADGTPTWVDYVLADGKVVAQRASTSGTVSNSYFVLDHLGSVAVATDDTGSGTTAERDSFDAWGAPRNIDGSDDTTCSKASVTTRGFTNQEEINALCLVNLNARIYDPTIGRFMAADSLVANGLNGQDWNRYTYVDNGPLSEADPSGHGFNPYCNTDPNCWGMSANIESIVVNGLRNLGAALGDTVDSEAFLHEIQPTGASDGGEQTGGGRKTPEPPCKAGQSPPGCVETITVTGNRVVQSLRLLPVGFNLGSSLGWASHETPSCFVRKMRLAGEHLQLIGDTMVFGAGAAAAAGATTGPGEAVDVPIAGVVALSGAGLTSTGTIDAWTADAIALYQTGDFRSFGTNAAEDLGQKGVGKVFVALSEGKLKDAEGLIKDALGSASDNGGMCSP